MSGAVRSDVELLQLLLDNIDELSTGLCQLVGLIYYGGDFSNEESNRLKILIRSNRPDSDIIEDITRYYWPVGEIHPRIDFLKQLIQKYGEPNNS